jgi:hypothetical protein
MRRLSIFIDAINTAVAVAAVVAAPYLVVAFAHDIVAPKASTVVPSKCVTLIPNMACVDPIKTWVFGGLPVALGALMIIGLVGMLVCILAESILRTLGCGKDRTQRIVEALDRTAVPAIGVPLGIMVVAGVIIWMPPIF